LGLSLCGAKGKKQNSRAGVGNRFHGKLSHSSRGTSAREAWFQGRLSPQGMPAMQARTLRESGRFIFIQREQRP
jgi:hypothetical protein